MLAPSVSIPPKIVGSERQKTGSMEGQLYGQEQEEGVASICNACKTILHTLRSVGSLGELQASSRGLCLRTACENPPNGLAIEGLSERVYEARLDRLDLLGRDCRESSMASEQSGV